MRFFFDNNLSPLLAASLDPILSQNGHSATHLRDKFSPDITDIDFISALADEGDWTIITADHHIYTRPHERQAWEESSLVVGILNPGWLSFPLTQQTARFLNKLDAIIDVAGKCAPGTSFVIPVTGRPRFR